MKILRLLSRYFLSIPLFIFFVFFSNVLAEEEPVDESEEDGDPELVAAEELNKGGEAEENGDAAMEDGRYEDAIRFYEAAIAAMPAVALRAGCCRLGGAGRPEGEEGGGLELGVPRKKTIIDAAPIEA